MDPVTGTTIADSGCGDETNIIGAVFEGSGSAISGTAATWILDENGHGTGTTASVLGEAPDALVGARGSLDC